jgi:2-polyprenyl-3-methyl-5-hydroxy-6-metoxy-1,4-benzoquinol methylase
MKPEIIEKFNSISSDYFAQSRKEMLPFMPKNINRLLDLGCHKGAFGYLIKLLYGAEVWGIELFEEWATVARQTLDKVIVGDVNTVMNDLPENYFDCITCNDVLEHLVDPYSVLAGLKSKLTTDGVIVASLPNVRYWDNLKNLLLKKQWKYMDHGILDRTHLRFFTELSLRDTFTDLGFEIVRMEGINPTGSDNLKIFNFLTFGALKDAKYLQFACVIKPRR